MLIYNKFPYKKYYIDVDKLKSKLIKLSHVNVNDYLTKTNCNAIFKITKKEMFEVDQLSDIYCEQIRIKCIFGKYTKSPYEDFFNTDVQQRIHDYLKDHQLKHEYANIRYAYSIFKTVKVCRRFSITHSLIIIKHFGAKRVFDLSAGWGDRLIGALYANVDVYHGYDANEKLIKSYRKIIQNNKKKNQDAIVHCTPAENANIHKNYYDLFISSPPFFDLEKYSDNKNQSDKRYNTLNTWLHSFFNIYLEKIFKGLKLNKFACIYISTYKNIDKYMHRYVTVILKQQFVGHIFIINSIDEQQQNTKMWIFKKIM